jgi:hypothetical protein
MTTSFGYKNHATYLVSLWLGNDQHLYNHFQEVAKETTTSELGDKIMDYVDLLQHNAELNGVLGDLLSSIIHDVDFYEVAEQFKDEG